MYFFEGRYCPEQHRAVSTIDQQEAPGCQRSADALVYSRDHFQQGMLVQETATAPGGGRPGDEQHQK